VRCEYAFSKAEGRRLGFLNSAILGGSGPKPPKKDFLVISHGKPVGLSEVNQKRVTDEVPLE